LLWPIGALPRPTRPPKSPDHLQKKSSPAQSIRPPPPLCRPHIDRAPAIATDRSNPMTMIQRATAQGSQIGRVAAFLYGLLAYTVFVVSFLYAVGFVEGLLVPKTIDSGPDVPMSEAIVVDLMLLSLFAVQHSVMARKQFKAWWTQFVPASIERSTYVLAASLALALLLWQWRPLADVVWEVADPQLAAAITGVSFLGFAVLLTSTFLINHFELFGLHQVAANLAGRDMPEQKFRSPFLYAFVRHPIYLGFIIAFWAAPVMTVGHLMFAAVTTAYIFVGIFLEERDLVALFGDEYRRYRKTASMIIPWRRSA
jgi:protein-S-isoprenylcysteine O-methyltransferase Ste14